MINVFRQISSENKNTRVMFNTVFKKIVPFVSYLLTYLLHAAESFLRS